MASEVDWYGTLGEGRRGLISLAELFSAVDTARASTYLAQYRSLGEIRSPAYYRHDVRREADEKYSTGVVSSPGQPNARVIGRAKGARLFERVGYDFAPRRVCERIRATVNRDLLPIIEEKLRHYQQSWLANELRGTIVQSKAPLSPMQQTVFDELCRGKSTAEIARTLGRSEHTISNHIKEIFKAFGVRSRAALLAKAALQGLLGNS